jgi:hypothetical protein
MNPNQQKRSFKRGEVLLSLCWGLLFWLTPLGRNSNTIFLKRILPFNSAGMNVKSSLKPLALVTPPSRHDFVLTHGKMLPEAGVIRASLPHD